MMIRLSWDNSEHMRSQFELVSFQSTFTSVRLKCKIVVYE